MDPGVQSTAYAACANNLPHLEDQLVSIVYNNGFDGVDIDFEDSNALQGIANPQYAAIPFLVDLTNDLEAQLGVKCPIMPSSPCLSIITHAPQNVYWTLPYNSAYIDVSHNTVDASGHANIAWFNNQTYNNCGADMTGTDCTEAQKVME
jgi:chitinase